MKYLLCNLVIALSGILACCVTHADSPTSEPRITEPEKLFAPILALHAQQENTGIAMALVDANKLLAEHYAGEAVVEHGIKVNRNTRFQVMSVTKAFIGAAILKSESMKLLDIDAPISRYLPDYPKPHETPITLRMLLSHTSGLPHLGHPDRKALYLQHFTSASDALVVFQDLPLLHPPGSKYSYSSSGYNLLAAILEAVHEKPIEQVLSELVFEPLGLAETRAGNALEPIANVARNYSYVEIWTYQPTEQLHLVPTWDFSYNSGGGNLVTTATDLAKFAQAFLREGFFTRSELERAYSKLDPEESRWGYGWFVNETNGKATLSISGATPGVQAGLQVDPNRQLAIAVLANAWGKDSAGGDLVVTAPRTVVESLPAIGLPGESLD